MEHPCEAKKRLCNTCMLVAIQISAIDRTKDALAKAASLRLAGGCFSRLPLYAFDIYPHCQKGCLKIFWERCCTKSDIFQYYILTLYTEIWQTNALAASMSSCKWEQPYIEVLNYWSKLWSLMTGDAGYLVS